MAPFFDFPASGKGFFLKDGKHIDYVKDPDLGDPLAGGETVVRVKASDDKYYALPFELGVYDPAGKRNVASKKWGKPIGVGYHWYDLGRVTLPERSFYLYATRKWTVQLPVSLPGMNGNSFEIKALVKFTGPKFFKNSMEPDEIRIARLIYVEP